MVYDSYCYETLGQLTHSNVHLGHLADAFIQSELHLSQEVKQYIAVGAVKMFIEPSAGTDNH